MIGCKTNEEAGATDSQALSALYFSSLVDNIEGFGWTRESQLESLGLSEIELADSRMRIEVEKVCAHFTLAEETLGRPDIALHTGCNFRVSTFGTTGSIFNFCDNLAHAVRLYGRYQLLVEAVGNCEFVEEGGRAYMQWKPRFEDDERCRAITEYIFGSYVSTIEWLAWGFNKGVKSVELRHSKPEHAEIYESLFKCPVTFDCDKNRLELFSDIVYAPLPMNNADKISQICTRLDKIMVFLEGETEISRKVRDAVRGLMGQKSVKLVNVANEMGVSERTLRRQLNAEGEKFRDIVDNVRMTMFDTLSVRGESLTSIAFMLGYNEQSSFTRACRRWYGMSPRAYRLSLASD